MLYYIKGGINSIFMNVEKKMLNLFGQNFERQQCTHITLGLD